MLGLMASSGALLEASSKCTYVLFRGLGLISAVRPPALLSIRKAPGVREDFGLGKVDF